MMMTREQLMVKLLTAAPEMLARVEAVLDNKQAEIAPTDRRLLTLGQAAKILSISRMTVYRMARDGRLPVVETRAGRHRIPSNALTDLLKGGAK